MEKIRNLSLCGGNFFAGLEFAQDDISRKLSVRRKLSSNPARMPISIKLLNVVFIEDGRAKSSLPPVRRKLSQLDQNPAAVASRRNYLCGGNSFKSLKMPAKFLRTASFLRTGGVGTSGHLCCAPITLLIVAEPPPLAAPTGAPSVYLWFSWSWRLG